MNERVLSVPVNDSRIIDRLLEHAHGKDYVQCLSCRSLRINTKLLVYAIDGILERLAESEDDLDGEIYQYFDELLPHIVESPPEEFYQISFESQELWEKENAHRRLHSRASDSGDDYVKYDDVVLAVSQKCECFLNRKP